MPAGRDHPAIPRVAGSEILGFAYSDDGGTGRHRQAVEDALVVRGVDSGRLTPIGIGPVAPVAVNITEDNRALNRRFELVARRTGR